MHFVYWRSRHNRKNQQLSYYFLHAKTNSVLYLCIYQQVETVGDKYMAVSGLPEPCEEHVRCIARLALDMMDLSHTVVVDGVPVVSIMSMERAIQKQYCMDHNKYYRSLSARNNIDVYFFLLIFNNIKRFFSALNNRYTQRRGSDGSDWSPDAPVLFIR